MRKVAAALAVALVVTLSPQSAGGASAAASFEVGSSSSRAPAVGGQFRAYWVDAFGDGLYTPAQIDGVCTRPCGGPEHRDALTEAALRK